MSELIDLVIKAREAMENSYAPYSDFPVGAALLTKNGKIFVGANVENSSYSASMCAERVAVFKAVGECEFDFDAIAVYNDKQLPYPCGTCLQVLNEFSRDKSMTVLVADKYETKEYTLAQLLPHGFNL